MPLPPPQERIARDFMTRKGFKWSTPIDVDKIEGRPIWYFRFNVPDGIVELEVVYNARMQDWECSVSTFRQGKVAN